MSSHENAQQDPFYVPPGMTSDPYKKDLFFGRTVVPVPLHNKPTKINMMGFEYREHSYIGDAINLRISPGGIEQDIPAKDLRLPLPNGLHLTYGQINGLSGDFYGTTNPISDGTGLQDQQSRFLDAYTELAERSATVPESAEILAILQAEIDAVNKALHEGKDPSTVYAGLPDVSLQLEAVTMKYRILETNYPAYAGLAAINWDHFGPDARIAYNAGHSVALQTAANGDLYTAYTQNAFADHFLEDSFSAGHLRTPRRGMHGTVDIFMDLCSKYMHDEDCAIGLNVSRPDGQSWTCYGDKRALDKVAADNYRRCVEAVQVSANEIYLAWKQQVVPTPDQYRVWTLAPTLESALAPQNLASFFRYRDAGSWSGTIDRRYDITDRRNDERASWWGWTYALTAAACKTDGWWNYPITINGPSSSASVKEKGVGDATSD